MTCEREGAGTRFGRLVAAVESRPVEEESGFQDNRIGGGAGIGSRFRSCG